MVIDIETDTRVNQHRCVFLMCCFISQSLSVSFRRQQYAQALAQQKVLSSAPPPPTQQQQQLNLLLHQALKIRLARRMLYGTFFLTTLVRSYFCNLNATTKWQKCDQESMPGHENISPTQRYYAFFTWSLCLQNSGATTEPLASCHTLHVGSRFRVCLGNAEPFHSGLMFSKYAASRSKQYVIGTKTHLEN